MHPRQGLLVQRESENSRRKGRSGGQLGKPNLHFRYTDWYCCRCIPVSSRQTESAPACMRSSQRTVSEIAGAERAMLCGVDVRCVGSCGGRLAMSHVGMNVNVASTTGSRAGSVGSSTGRAATASTAYIWFEHGRSHSLFCFQFRVCALSEAVTHS